MLTKDQIEDEIIRLIKSNKIDGYHLCFFDYSISLMLTKQIKKTRHVVHAGGDLPCKRFRSIGLLLNDIGHVYKTLMDRYDRKKWELDRAEKYTKEQNNE